MRRRIRRLVRRIVSRQPARGPTAEHRPANRPTAWHVVELATAPASTRVVIRLPAAHRFNGASLALVQRETLNEIVIEALVEHDLAVAEVAAEIIESFGSGTMDLWLEVTGDRELFARRRVCLDRDRIGDRTLPISAGRVNWYATNRGNFSASVTVSERPNVPTPVLARVEDKRDHFELWLDFPGDGPVEDTLVARTQPRGRLVTFHAAPGAPVAITSDELTALGVQPADLFAVRATAGGEVVRARLIAGKDVKLRPVACGLGHLESSPAGHVTIRHASPAETIAAFGVFDEPFYREQVPELPAHADAIEHYVASGAARGLDPSRMFDTEYYLRMNPAVETMNPLQHYCEFGWKDLSNPSPLFDTWWYWAKHLDLADESVMPLAHYERVGKGEGLSTRPDRFPSRTMRPGHSWALGQVVRRVCLFAAYDADGIVDDYVVDFVRELSRFADVYYLADSDMAESELGKLAAFTKGAWAERHGEYDFGSYKRLAERVGWSVLEEYDEVLFVNDSCFLLSPLDEVFSRMDKLACDWWGLQATKGMASTRAARTSPHREPISMSTVRFSMVDRFEDDYTYDFHVASYFLAYRTPVIQDPEFRRYLHAVTRERTKRNVIRKYEIGFTRWLIHHGHGFYTAIRQALPLQSHSLSLVLRTIGRRIPPDKAQLLGRQSVPGAEARGVDKPRAGEVSGGGRVSL